jgi:hypothetical protein
MSLRGWFLLYQYQALKVLGYCQSSLRDGMDAVPNLVWFDFAIGE